MTINGRVVDLDTGGSLPGATVEAWTGSLMLARTAADSNGFFSLSFSSSPDRIIVTSASYKGGVFSYPGSMSNVFKLEKNIVEGEPVVIKSGSGKGGSWWLWGALGLFLLMAVKKK